MFPERPSADTFAAHAGPPGENPGPIELSDEVRAELLDPEAWGEVLGTYAATTRLAVALTDTRGRLLGECRNPQPVWLLANTVTHLLDGVCPFCMSPQSPCEAVARALSTNEVVTARDGAGLVHMAVPLSLAGRRFGALIAGQVFDRYPEPLPLQRVARDYGVSREDLWHQATRQIPVTLATLQMFGNLLRTLGDAFLGQRYAAVLQRKLAATDLRYRLMVDGLEEYGLYTVDRAGSITSWNRGAERLFGYTAAEIVGHDYTCLLLPEDVRSGTYEVALQNADVKGWTGYEGWRVRKDGTRFFVTGLLATLGEGDSREYGRLVRDVTELHRTEEVLRQAQKLESIGVLAGGIAHDFNNLLTGIMAGVTYATESLPPDHPAQSLLKVAEDSTVRASELTAQLLAYAGKGKFVITRFDLSTLVKEMLPLIDTSIPKTVQVQLLLSPGLPWMEGDASQIRQIVMNLIINGAESIGENGGTVRVSTGVRDRPVAAGNSTMQALKPVSQVFLEVKDSGSGMSETTRAKIFDPFFTTKSAGRGLGLAAVGGILRGHKGKMEIASALGEGTTITVAFPAFEPLVPPVLKRVSPVATPGTGTVLFVDDEPALRQIGIMVLEKAGYSVLVAEDGREAVDIFQQNASHIVAVLLDIAMPTMGGTEAFRLIREIRPDVPIILMTGFTEDTAREDVGAGAVVGFLQKPYSVAKLVAKVRALLETPPHTT